MKRLIALAALGAAALAVQPALAQPAQPAAQSAAQSGAKSNPKAPIDITADQLVTHSADCVAVWTGSAEALQDNSRLRADVLTVKQEVKKDKPAAAANPNPTTGGMGSGACGEMVSVEAERNVYYVSADGRRVHGDHGFYDVAHTTITITGDVTAVEGQDVMRGTKMVYNTDTGEGHVEGGAKGPNAKNRPRAVYYPKDAGSTPGDKPKKAAK